MRCEILAYQEKADLPEKLHEDWCTEVVEDGFSPWEAWGRQAVGIASTERLKMERQMAATADKKQSVFAITFPGSE